MKFLKKIKWDDIRIWLVLISMIFLFAFSNNKNKNSKIERVEVEFIGDEKLFMTTQGVDKLLKENFLDTSNISKSVLDLNKLELKLLNHDLIDDAQVYVTVDGVLTAQVAQKKAIGRVIFANTSYYIDSNGNDMPMSYNYSARVPLVEGLVNDDNRAGITTVLKLIEKDEFLKKNIAGIVIQPNRMLIMKSRNHNFDILFGNCEEIERKFANYKAFIHYATRDTLIDSYKSINLKFTQQVVCTKF